MISDTAIVGIVTGRSSRQLHAEPDRLNSFQRGLKLLKTVIHCECVRSPIRSTYIHRRPAE
jgi:hypothetical protein